jgi:hypothetical protein
MAAVAVGIGCTGPLGEKQSYLPYPDGPSHHALAFPRSRWIKGRSNAPRYLYNL